MRKLSWFGIHTKEFYVEEANLPLLEVNESFFDKVKSQKVLNDLEYHLLKKHNFKAILKNNKTGECLGISTFGLPYSIFYGEPLPDAA